MTTIEILEALRAKFGNVSDYRVAKELGTRQQLISQWRSGHVMSDTWAIKCADALGVSRAYLVACVNAERVKEEDTETSGVWRQIADAFHDKVALWLCAITLVFTGFLTQPATAGDLFSAANNIHYAKLAARRMRTRSRKRAPN